MDGPERANYLRQAQDAIHRAFDQLHSVKESEAAAGYVMRQCELAAAILQRVANDVDPDLIVLTDADFDRLQKKGWWGPEEIEHMKKKTD